MNTYDFKNNTFTTKEQSFAAVEVGDSKQPDFFPQAKIMRWGNEVNCSVRLVHQITEPKISEAGGVVSWIGKDLSAHFYEFGGGKVGGGFEFDIHLLKMPKSNILQFTMQTKGLDFHYQPPLTREEIEQGCERPEWAVGSYAVYGRRSGDYTAFDHLLKPEMQIEYPCIHDYKAGKAFSIPRPQLIDNNGRTCWSDLDINERPGLLTVTIPWDFLKSAAYPIRHAAGLAFGYDHIGATADNAGGTNNWFLRTAAGDTAPALPAASGALQSILCYCRVVSGSPILNPALYAAPGVYPSDVPTTRLAYLNSGGTAIGVGDAWVETLATGTLAYAGIIAGTNYRICVGDPSTAGVFRGYYDAIAGINNINYCTRRVWPDPAPGMAQLQRIYSAYAKYTSGAAGPLVNSIPLKSLLRGLVTK